MKMNRENNLCEMMNSGDASPLLLLPSPLSWLLSSEMPANREAWLKELMYRLAEYMEEIKPGSCENLNSWRVTCGWPGGGSRHKRIGECWSEASSKGGLVEMFISPMLDEPASLDHVLLHEMVHASVGTKCGHRGEFKKLAKKLGLEGRMTATVPGEALRKKLDEILASMRPYPHAGLSPGAGDRKVQTTRMKKCRCVECGYIIRATQLWLDKGIPRCYCGGEFTMSS